MEGMVAAEDIDDLLRHLALERRDRISLYTHCAG